VAKKAVRRVLSHAPETVPRQRQPFDDGTGGLTHHVDSEDGETEGLNKTIVAMKQGRRKENA
jgi:hypothetical protein